MSYIAGIAAKQFREITLDVLNRSQFGRPSERANTQAAARWVTEEGLKSLSALAKAGLLNSRLRVLMEDNASRFADRSSKAIGRNRRLLDRVAYRHRSRLQRRSASWLAVLLECIEGGVSARCLEALDPWDDPVALKHWRSGDWGATPGTLEIVALLTSGDSRDRKGLQKLLERTYAELLPDDPQRPAIRDAALVVGRHVLKTGNRRFNHPLADGLDHASAQFLPGGPLPTWVHRKLDEFRAWGKRRGHEEHRITRSVHRVLAPLCWSRRTKGIEISWYDLPTGRRRQAIRLGLAVERIWLGDTPALERR